MELDLLAIICGLLIVDRYKVTFGKLINDSNLGYKPHWKIV